MKVQLNFNISTELKERFDNFAEKRGVNKTKYLNIILERALDKEEEDSNAH